jgi:flagellar biosynthesis protein FlhB
MADKTEAPTSRRLVKARESGNVAKSNELNNAVSLLAGIFLLSMLARSMVAGMKDILTTALSLPVDMDFNAGGVRHIAYGDLLTVGPWIGLFFLGMLATGILINLIQTGPMITTSKLGIHLERINPLSRLSQMVSLNGLMELAKAVVKLLIIGGVVYAFLQERMQELMSLVQMDIYSAISMWAGLAYEMMIRAAIAYGVLAVVDYVYQRWSWMRGLKMTKEEVKEDNKMSEGDPFIRGRIRQQQRKIARMRMMSNIKKADVIITNPTHLAIALAYDAHAMQAPRVLAKGADFVAAQIIARAREFGIPIMQNIPLAHSLFKTVAIDQEVPPALYVAMAQVMAYVYRLRGKPASGPVPAPSPAGEAPIDNSEDILREWAPAANARNEYGAANAYQEVRE